MYLLDTSMIKVFRLLHDSASRASILQVERVTSVTQAAEETCHLNIEVPSNRYGLRDSRQSY